MRDDELLCEGVIRVACVSSASMKPCALPQDIHSQLDRVFRL
jgi:4-hydroxybenzoyl-CoA thioesterase